MADENTTTTTTNSSQQLTIEDDLDILFQNTLYVRSDDEESDDETMDEEVVYRPTYTMYTLAGYYPRNTVIPVVIPKKELFLPTGLLTMLR